MLTDAEIMAQVLAAFQEEQAEHRQAIGELLLELERHPDHPQRQAQLDQLFREAHSLKGGARAAGQAEIEQIAHRMEDIFSAVRQGILELTPDVCDPVYAALDAIGALMAHIAAGQPADLSAYRSLMEMLSSYARLALERRGAPARNAVDVAGNGDSSVAEAQPGQAGANGTRGVDPARTNGGARVAPALDEGDAAAANDGLPQVGEATIRISTTSLDAIMNETGELVTCSLQTRQHAREMTQLTHLTRRWRRVWRQIGPAIARLADRSPGILPAVHYLDDRVELPAGPTERSGNRETEVLVKALQEANDLIADLDRHLVEQGRQIGEDSSRLATVVDRLHGQVRRARMVPLRTIFGQIRLQGREMSRAIGKPVALEFDDGEAEADREILERLREVLIHLLRNAIDHGIEPADARQAAGKPAEGHISLRAEVDGDRLSIWMEDDGAGVDLNAVGRRAVASNIVGENELARMSEAEILQLLFLPGFTTRQSVSTLSGRGVGLDIVRSHVERMRGHVDVRSTVGHGSVFTLSVPLSLTSVHGLILQAGGASYALPLDAIQRIVAVGPGDVEMLEGRAALVQNGRPVPLAQLADLLGGAAARAGERALAARALVLGTGERQVACLVDTILSEQNLVIHRLPAPLQEVRFVAGATILHDGSVVPILDITDLLNATIGAHGSLPRIVEEREPRRVQTVLVVDDSITTRTLEKNILEAAGYRVRLATDGVEAIQMLDQMADDGGCDLLLSDVDMPQLNGFDLTARVRGSARYSHLPVVLVTSLDTAEDRERGITAGADAYIVKRQFDQQVLLKTISQLL